MDNRTEQWSLVGIAVVVVSFEIKETSKGESSN